ncbi:ribosome recycling factor [Candidatus Venteria ishoeyi]|uniref:Ribosome-recycling factor n=1 Tax=Candidatus Venteria ishoeyi TaxID=1899563 RepID=A0A1H6F742_9GAMM|nr:ribosome recycling factor [Candidatus Venteria ishoeyi]MDM8547982.1 ribosome recycling factor [Candidatus Venteria ishoeyi]SEH05938.1 Ribosome-recycling factor [Candidatus Venteria ishoeyi]
MIEEIKQDSASRMEKSLESLRQDFIKIRTGRAHTSLLDHLSVPYYGNDTPLSQVANVTVIDSRTLGVTPWEKPMVTVVEKAIMDSDLGLNPSTAGMLIRIPLPSMTEERRKELVKLVRGEAEGGRIAMRNIRRDANNQLKKMVKDKEISEDDERRGEDVVQKLTDQLIAKVDALLAEKEAELMEV